MKTKDDTPYKRAVHMIIQSVVNVEEKYWLDEKYIRWDKIERDLFTLEDRHLSSERAVEAGKAERCTHPMGYIKSVRICGLCGEQV